MNKTKQYLLIVAAIFSPVWVGLIIGGGNGIVVLIGSIMGIPIITLCGVFISFANRSNVNSSLAIGYPIPAILVCGWMVMALR